jgi:hypothetical protein
MKDFDTARAERHKERQEEFGEKPFKFGGEVFYVRANVGYLAIKRVAALTDSSTGAETFDAIEESVFSMIEPRDDALERFLAVTRSLEDPVTFEDLVELQNWLIQEQTRRPPTEQSPSSDSQPKTGARSTGSSSGKREEASTS